MLSTFQDTLHALLFSPHNDSMIQTLLLAPFYRPGPCHREVNQLSQDHTASKWQSHESNPDLALLTTVLTSLLSFSISVSHFSDY